MPRQQCIVFAFYVNQIHHTRLDRCEAEVCLRKGDRYYRGCDRYWAHAIRDQASERFLEFLERSQLRIAHVTEIASLLPGEQITIGKDRDCCTHHSDDVSNLR